MINLSDTLQQQDQKQTQQYFTKIKALMKQQSANYWIGNPSVQIISGELCLKRYHLPQEGNSIECYLRQLKESNSISSTCLVIVGVPTCVRPLEVWESLADTQQFIQECRVVKTQEPGFYSLLIRLSSKQYCEQFYNFSFGKKINELENYLILFRQISSITIQFDQFSISERTQLQIFKRKKTNQIHAVDPLNIFMTYTIDQSAVNTSFVCAICFEDMMTSSEGVLSILCGHYFHQSCLSKWNQHTCPLCRYHQQPPTLSFCEACNNSDNLWLCLVCGKRFCSGDQQILESTESHIYQHFKEVQHSIAMEIESKFIYEFSLKDFLHRVYFNQKTREPSAGIQQKSKKSKDIVKQYENVTMIEMEDQRKYFQKKLAEDRKKHKQIIQNLLNEINHFQQLNSKLVTEYDHQKEQKDYQQLQSQLRTSQKYHGLLVTKIKAIDGKISKISQNEQMQIQKLNQQIMEKRQEIKDIQQNINANRKIKKKLEGQKISMEYFVKK